MRGCRVSVCIFMSVCFNVRVRVRACIGVCMPECIDRWMCVLVLEGIDVNVSSCREV